MKNSEKQSKWAILKAEKGIVTKKDKEILQCWPRKGRDTSIMIFSRSKEALMERLDSVEGKLSKNYKVLIITDEQFGKMQMQKHDFDCYKAALEVATEKQKKRQLILTCRQLHDNINKNK